MRHDIEQLTTILKQRNIELTSFIEIGSRDGHDTNYVRHYWGLDSNKCFIIEAHPGCYEYISNTYPQYPALNIAASNKTEIIEFNAGIIGVEKNVGVSSVLTRTVDEFISNRITVDAWRMDEVMQYNEIESIDFAKIDVEGYALQVLQGFGDKLETFKALQIELETKQVWNDQSYYSEVVEYLNAHDFEILHEVKLDEYQTDVLFIKKNL
jgi:FkbM family methyltransferase